MDCWLSDELFEETFRNLDEPLRGFAYGLTWNPQTQRGDWEIAADLVQSAFLKLYQQKDKERIENMKNWLITVVRNDFFGQQMSAQHRLVRHSLDHEGGDGRQLAIADSLHSPQSLPAELAALREKLEPICICLDKHACLNDQEKDVVRHLLLNGGKRADIACKLNVNLSRISQIWKSAAAKLRACCIM